jgi:hypothetical protein
VIPKDRLGALRGRLCRGHGLSLRRRPDGRAGLLLSLHDIVVRAVGGADAHEGFASAGAPLGLHIKNNGVGLICLLRANTARHTATSAMETIAKACICLSKTRHTELPLFMLFMQ